MLQNKEIIRVDALEYRYQDKTQALKGIQFSVNQGERLAVLGSNGSGKTTLFLCLIGILRPTSGGIFYEGKPIEYDRRGLIRLRKKIGIVFQDPDTQLFCVNVFQEVAFGPSNMDLTEADIHQRALVAMGRADVTALSDKAPHLLSYGQKKRVSIASVLAMEPDILIFDEPTSSLDPQHAREIRHLIDDLNKAGATILLSTHDMDLALDWADSIVVLKDGLVAKHGTPFEVFSDEALFRSADLHLPTVFRLYRYMIAQGYLAEASEVPRNIEQLESLLVKSA